MVAPGSATPAGQDGIESPRWSRGSGTKCHDPWITRGDRRRHARRIGSAAPAQRKNWRKKIEFGDSLCSFIIHRPPTHAQPGL